jgi:tRNA G18 (ribose-2'-O)-methylase SpoU
MTRPFQQITSLDDPRIEVYRDIKDKDLRNMYGGLFMAESEMAIRRLLQFPDRIHSVLFDPVRHHAIADALHDLPEKIPVYVAAREILHDIVGFHLHRGALAAAHRPDPTELTLGGALGHLRDQQCIRLVLGEAITNHDNMGALFRNAAAFGVDGIVLDDRCCDPLYRKSLRVSIGNVLAVPYAVSTSWHDDLERLRSAWGITLVAAEPLPGAVPLPALPASERIGLLFGTEGAGIDDSTLQRCDSVCQIPMADGVSSLNVAVASAVFLYELQRRR